MTLRYCDYCKKWIECENGYVFGGHRTSCESNPKRKEIDRLNSKMHSKSPRTYRLTCETCGKTFKVRCCKRPNRKYCCRECSCVSNNNYYHILLECPYCGEFHHGMRQHVHAMHTNKQYGMDGYTSWIKGLTKDTDERVSNIASKISESLKLTWSQHPELWVDFNRKKNLPELQKYYEECKFDFNLFNFPEEFDFDLIDKYGWYKTKGKNKNMRGVSRDHMISISYGFKNSILPEIIAHPANCRIIKQQENDSKGGNISISINQLEQRINEWNIKYG